MAWRIHLANRALYRVDILSTSHSRLLAAWSQPNRVSYYDLGTGARLRDQQLHVTWDELRIFDDWQTLREQVSAPDGSCPPVLACPDGLAYLTRQGDVRVYYTAQGQLILARGERDFPLQVDALHALVVERDSGLVALLDSAMVLHLHYESAPLAQVDLGVSLNRHRRLELVACERGATVFVAHDDFILRVDTQMQTVRCVELHYRVGRFASAPSGRLCACAETDTNVIRIYDGRNMMPLYQGHATDLMADADELQLIADLPPSRVAVSNLTLDDHGNMAFALAGVVCVTHITALQVVPRVHQIA